MTSSPAPVDLPLRARVGWACKYSRLCADDTPATIAGRLHRDGLLDDLDMRVITETLEARQ